MVSHKRSDFGQTQAPHVPPSVDRMVARVFQPRCVPNVVQEGRINKESRACVSHDFAEALSA